MVYRSDMYATTNLFTLILQIPQIERCSNVVLELNCVYQPVKLPIDAISNWLNRTSTDRRKERVLNVELFETQNLVEIWDHLEKVSSQFSLLAQSFLISNFR